MDCSGNYIMLSGVGVRLISSNWVLFHWKWCMGAYMA